MRREDGTGGGSNEEGKDDAGEFGEFVEAGMASCGMKGVI
jgi:hypothetical protein